MNAHQVLNIDNISTTSLLEDSKNDEKNMSSSTQDHFSSDLPYWMTPQSPELNHSTNQDLVKLRNNDWIFAGGDGTVIYSDINRGYLVEGSKKSKKASRSSLITLLQKLHHPSLSTEQLLDNLSQHYSQNLSGFVSFNLCYTCLSLAVLITPEPTSRIENFYYDPQLNRVYFETIHTDFRVCNTRKELYHPILKGTSQSLWYWIPEKGFQLEKLSFSNSVIRELGFHDKKFPITEEKLQHFIYHAAHEELGNLVRALRDAALAQQDAALKKKYLEIYNNIEQLFLFYIKEQKALAAFIDFIRLLLAQITHPEKKIDDFKMAELASNIYFVCPAAKKISEDTMPFDTQYHYAYLALVKTIDHLPPTDLRQQPARDFLSTVNTFSIHRPDQKPLLAQTLWKMKYEIETANNRLENISHRADLIETVNKIGIRSWKRTLAGAVLAIVGLTVVGLCCATGAGAIALPFLAWGLSYFLAGSVTTSLIGMGLFGEGVQKSPQHKMNTVLKVTDKIPAFR